MPSAGEMAQKTEQVVHEGARAGTGQVPGTDIAMGHPIHPATVHWPIAVSMLSVLGTRPSPPL